MNYHTSVENEFFGIENENMSKSAILPNDQFDKGELEDEHGIERPFTNSELSIQFGNEQDQQVDKFTSCTEPIQRHSILLQQEDNVYIIPDFQNVKSNTQIPDLEKCLNCGRRFFMERLHLHSKTCTPEHPLKSKHLDIDQTQTLQGRIKQFIGTKNETKNHTPKYHKLIQLVSSIDDVKTNDTENNIKIPRWKQEHQQLVDSIRYSREVEKAQKNGTNVKELQAPKNPLEENYVFCQFCRRKFAPYVAERHIPRCKNIFNRPQPPKRQSLDSGHKKTAVKALEKYSQYVGASINEEVEEVDNDTQQQHSQTVKATLNQSQIFREGADQTRMSQSQQQSSSGSSVFLPRISPYVPMMSRSTPMVECSKCKRSFDLKAAQRHIPICQQLQSKEDKSLATLLSPNKQQIQTIEYHYINKWQQSYLQFDGQNST